MKGIKGSLTNRRSSLKIDVSSKGPLSGVLTPDEGPSPETSIFPLLFQVVREPLPFACINGLYAKTIS